MKKMKLYRIKSNVKHTFNWRPMNEKIKEDRPIIFLTENGAMKTFKYGLHAYESTAVAWCYQSDLIPDFSNASVEEAPEKPYKRWQEIDGIRWYNGLPPNESTYILEGYEKLRDAFIATLKYRKNVITCDFIRNINGTGIFCDGGAKRLNICLEHDDDLTMEKLWLMLCSLPAKDPEWKAKEKHFYEVEWPERLKRHRIMLQKTYTEEFEKLYERKPNPEDKQRIAHQVDYTMQRLPGATITPGLAGEMNSIEVMSTEPLDYEPHPKIDSFIEWLNNVDLTHPKLWLPNGEVGEYMRISLKEWKIISNLN